MKNNKLNFIIFIIIFTIMLICPMKADAKTYYISETYWPWKYPLDILGSGDVLDFSNCYDSYKYTLFLDGEAVNDCYGKTSECNLQYTIKEKIVYSNFNYHGNGNESLYFNKMADNQELLIYDDSTVDGYYKSGDVIAFYTEKPANVMAFYVYDENDNIIISEPYYSFNPPTYKLPQINGKDVYWKLESFVTPGNYYSGKCPHFTPIEYEEPKIELKCDKDKINYEEKTKCEVYLESLYKMSNLNFSINHKNLKLSNISYLDGVTNSNDNSQTMKLSFSEDTSFNEKRVIMTFDVEGTKDSTYLDKITLNNIEYTDEVVTGKYKDLDSNLNIVSTTPTTNPETGIRTLFIIMPILLLIIIASTSLFRNKKKVTN